MKTTHIIWDWNGTLLDDVDISVLILNDMLLKHKKPTITKEKYLDVFMFPIKSYYKLVGLEMSDEEFTKIAADYVRRYISKSSKAHLHSGVLEAITRVKSLGISQIIISASEQNLLSSQLDAFGLNVYFDGIYGLDNCLARSKADIAKSWLFSSGVDPQNILFIGDTLHDHEIALSTGGRCVLIAAGHQSKEKLLSCGAEVLESAEELCHYLVSM